MSAIAPPPLPVATLPTRTRSASQNRVPSRTARGAIPCWRAESIHQSTNEARGIRIAVVEGEDG